MDTRLLVVASTYPSRAGDGTPAFVRDLALAESVRYRTTVLVPATPGTLRSESDGPLTVRRFRYFLSRWENLTDGAILENLRRSPLRWTQVPFLFLAEVLAIRRTVRRERTDIIHAHWLIPQGLAALVAAPRVPALITAHGGDIYACKDPLSRWLLRLVSRHASVLTAVNSEMRDRLISLGADPKRTHVASMGVNVQEFAPPHEETGRIAGRILFVGRLVEKKGLSVLIRSLRGMDTATLEMVVVGDGPLKEHLRASACELPIHFRGRVDRDEVARELKQASVVVFPSLPATSGDQDGLPVALLEAMSAACPVIASRLPGLAEAVVDGESGVLVTPGDVEELRRGIVHLLADADLRRRLGEGARRRSRDYSMNAVGSRYVALLDEIHSQSGRGVC